MIPPKLLARLPTDGDLDDDGDGEPDGVAVVECAASVLNVEPRMSVTVPGVMPGTWRSRTLVSWVARVLAAGRSAAEEYSMSELV